MSIWAQLEQDSKRDVELLNQAMVLLTAAASKPNAEKYFRDRVVALEDNVNAHLRNNYRFSSCSIVYDTNELARIIRGEET